MMAGGIRRYPVVIPNYGMADALSRVEAIGRERDPRFVIDEENRFVYENMVRWVHGYASMRCLHPRTWQAISGRTNRGIYIGGKTGTGKSLCLDVMFTYSQLIGAEYSSANVWREHLLWRSYRADEMCDLYAKTGELMEMKRVGVLAIQDLGCEPMETCFMGNRVDVVEQVLANRGDRLDETITLISSNLIPCGDDFLKRYGERVTSRLMEMCNFFVLTGEDRRNVL